MTSTANSYIKNKKADILRLIIVVSTVFTVTSFSAGATALFTLPPDQKAHRHADTFSTGFPTLKPEAVYTFTAMKAAGLLGVSGDIKYNEKYKAGQLMELTPGGPPGSKQIAAPWQKWYVRFYETVDQKKYYTILNVFSGQLLSCDTANNASAPSGKEGIRPVQTRVSSKPYDAQLWRFVFDPGSKTFVIYNKKSGEMLAAKNKTVQSKAIVTLISNGENKKTTCAAWTLQELPAVPYRDDAVVGFFERSKPFLGSVAFDQGNSIPLSWGPNKGKVLWVTQDAWDGQQLKTNGMFDCKDFFRYRNSMILQPSIRDWDPTHTFNIEKVDSRQHKPKQICDVLPTAEYSWPAAGIEIGRYVYVQCSEGDGLGPPKSQSLYQLTENDGLNWQVKRLTPKGMTTEHKINYSAGMVKSPDGFVYVFGFKGTGYGYSLDLHVARFKPSLPMQWTFWNKSNWQVTPEADSKARIASGKATVSVAYLNGKYILMTMDQGFVCDSARSIYLATSSSPTGPFTPLKKVYTINEYLYGKYARYYTPVIHPEFNNGHRELLLTYCLNFSGCGVPDCKDGYLDPYFYRIKGIRIPYDMIGL